jgi:molecular chaperone HtpG
MVDPNAASLPTEHPFKAEVQRVLGLVIHSLYTNREVFLRELVSNASDALDKARFLQASGAADAAEQIGEPAIEIQHDAQAHTVTVEDNGVGMTREEAVEQLGTIARSGTGEFLERLDKLAGRGAGDAERKEALELIGQFGVGFYAAFMVAKRVDVHTLSMKKGAEPVLWRSTGEGTFSVLAGERDRPGTRVVLHLKDDATDFALPWRLQALVRKYSDFIQYPIRVNGERQNRGAAPWRQARAQIGAAEHADLYRHLTQGRLGEEPLAWLHAAVDAPEQFYALLYIPAKATPELLVPHGKRTGVRLYAKRVLVMESCDLVTPPWLRFLRGVVDSEDLTLNISRETLQEDRTIKQIEQQLTRQVLKRLEELASEDPERYDRFWTEFGPVVKEGIALDFRHKDAIAGLCRYESLRSEPGKRIGLKEYVAAKQADQKAIYFISGPSREQVAASPHLEVFRARGIDVLFMTDPIDEWVVQALGRFEGLELTSVAHGELDLGGDQPATAEADRGEAAVRAVKRALGERVSDVRLSTRLTETASCLVARAGDPGANLERIMRVVDERLPEHKRILELNARHAFVQNLGRLASERPDDARVVLWSEMLYDLALLAEGVVEDQARLGKRLQDLLVESSSRAVG